MGIRIVRLYKHVVLVNMPAGYQRSMFRSLAYAIIQLTVAISPRSR